MAVGNAHESEAPEETTDSEGVEPCKACNPFRVEAGAGFRTCSVRCPTLGFCGPFRAGHVAQTLRFFHFFCLTQIWKSCSVCTSNAALLNPTGQAM